MSVLTRENLSDAFKMIAADFPTIDQAWACMDCQIILRKVNPNGSCTRCGSISTFDAAKVLNRGMEWR